MTTESTVRWVATGGAVVTAGGLGLSLPLSIPPALVWTVLFVICGAIAVVMWRRHLDELLTEKHRQQNRPDTPHRAAQTAEQQFSRRNTGPRDEPEPVDDGPSYGP